MSRHLHIAPEVAKAIPASYIAQMESQVDDHDNVCGVCLSFIDTDVVNLYAAYDPAEGGIWDIRMAHPALSLGCCPQGQRAWRGPEARHRVVRQQHPATAATAPLAALLIVERSNAADDSLHAKAMARSA